MTLYEAAIKLNEDLKFSWNQGVGITYNDSIVIYTARNLTKEELLMVPPVFEGYKVSTCKIGKSETSRE